MAMLSVRVPDDLAARFDVVACASGGRSAMLRRLIAESVGEAATTARAGSRARTSVRLMVRLGAPEAAHVDVQAEAMGLKRAGWVAALVRRHALGRPQLASSDEVTVQAARAEIHRIGVNVNQIARSLNAGRRLGSPPDLAELGAMRRELRAHLVALGQAFRGNLDYWDVGR